MTDAELKAKKAELKALKAEKEKLTIQGKIDKINEEIKYQRMSPEEKEKYDLDQIANIGKPDKEKQKDVFNKALFSNILFVGVVILIIAICYS